MRPELSSRAYWDQVRCMQQFPATAREVSRIEYLEDGEPVASEVGMLDDRDHSVWMVCGIFEPADPHDPWTIAMIAQHDGKPVLRNPSITIAQESVYRVHDGIKFA